LNPCKVDVRIFTIGFLAGNTQRICPGNQRSFNWQRFQRVIRLRQVSRVAKILRVEMQGIAIKEQDLPENLLLGNVIVTRSSLTQYVKAIPEIMIIGCVVWTELDGLIKVFKRLVRRTDFAITVRQVVIDRRVSWIQF